MGYLRPRTLDDALAALASGPRVILAGGTDHFPARMGIARPEDILDITALPGLRAIETRSDGWWIPCGATWTDVTEAGLPDACNGLVSAAHRIGGRQVQNTGTLVGNLCNASPAADGIPCLMAMDATVELASARGWRALPIEEFLLGARRTARQPDEMVLGIALPSRHPASTTPFTQQVEAATRLLPPPPCGEGEGTRHRDRARDAMAAKAPLPSTLRSSFLKLGARKYLVISIAMVAVSAHIDNGRITAIRIAIGACGPSAQRLPALEASLIGQNPAIPDIDPTHFAALAPIDDIRAPAAYRREAAVELTRRAVMALA